MRNNEKISMFFDRFSTKPWWPYAAEVVMPSNEHRLETVELLWTIDRELAAMVRRRWQLTMFCFCGWLERQEAKDEAPNISGVEDVVCSMHNYLMPGTPTGEAVRAVLAWAGVHDWIKK